MLHKIGKNIDVRVSGQAEEVSLEGAFLRVRFGAATALYKGVDQKDRVISFGNRALLVPNFNFEAGDRVAITMEWKSGYASLINDLDLNALMRGEAPSQEIYKVTEIMIEKRDGRQVHEAALDIAA